jgi:hypothetical protein
MILDTGINKEEKQYKHVGARIAQMDFEPEHTLQNDLQG